MECNTINSWCIYYLTDFHHFALHCATVWQCCSSLDYFWALCLITRCCVTKNIVYQYQVPVTGTRGFIIVLFWKPTFHSSPVLQTQTNPSTNPNCKKNVRKEVLKNTLKFKYCKKIMRKLTARHSDEATCRMTH